MKNSAICRSTVGLLMGLAASGTLAVNVSLSGGGDGVSWHQGTNCSCGVVPSAGSDVTINVPKSGPTISGGTLRVATTVQTSENITDAEATMKGCRYITLRSIMKFWSHNLNRRALMALPGVRVERFQMPDVYDNTRCQSCCGCHPIAEIVSLCAFMPVVARDTTSQRCRNSDLEACSTRPHPCVRHPGFGGGADIRRV